MPPSADGEEVLIDIAQKHVYMSLKKSMLYPKNSI